MMSHGSVELQLSQKCHALSLAKTPILWCHKFVSSWVFFQMKHYLAVWVTVVISHVPPVRGDSLERLVALVAKEVCICKQKSCFSLTTYPHRKYLQFTSVSLLVIECNMITQRILVPENFFTHGADHILVLVHMLVSNVPVLGRSWTE